MGNVPAEAPSFRDTGTPPALTFHGFSAHLLGNVDTVRFLEPNHLVMESFSRLKARARRDGIVQDCDRLPEAFGLRQVRPCWSRGRRALAVADDVVAVGAAMVVVACVCVPPSASVGHERPCGAVSLCSYHSHFLTEPAEDLVVRRGSDTKFRRKFALTFSPPPPTHKASSIPAG